MVFQLLSLLGLLLRIPTTVNQIYAQQFENAGDAIIHSISL